MKKTKLIKASELKVGDKIKSFENGEIVYKSVVDVWETTVEVERQVKLTFVNRSTLSCSTNHPIMIIREAMMTQVMPLELTKEDKIITETGFTFLECISQDNKPTSYIDLTVEDTNVFFASQDGSDMILTHNCSQGGLRGGAATVNYPIWHLEFEKLIVLKNNKGVDENRIRHMDYAPSISKLMFERLAADDYITLFSPDVADGKLYEAYFLEDQSIFKELYEKLEKDSSIRKSRVKASELFSLFIVERVSTNRIYPLFVTNVNTHGPYKEPVKLGNLCMEILPPTTPVGQTDEEIALCTLAAVNVGIVETQEDMQRVTRLIIRALDNLLDYQDYPHKAALIAKKRRALGVGVINMAYLFAKNFVRYSDTDYNNSANKLMHRTSESMQFWLLKASNELAKERGACEYHNRTKYSDGLLPIDWYNKNVDDLVSPELECDWESLRADIKEDGLRHSTVTAWMPGETSAQVPNGTNGPYSARGIVTLKESKEGIYAQLVPEIETLATEYETTWQMVKRSGNTGWLGKMSIGQKFIDNGISCDTYEDPSLNADGKIQLTDGISDMCYAQRHGIKTFYYSITRDGVDGNVDESDCEACKM